MQQKHIPNKVVGVVIALLILFVAALWIMVRNNSPSKTSTPIPAASIQDTGKGIATYLANPKVNIDPNAHTQSIARAIYTWRESHTPKCRITAIIPTAYKVEKDGGIQIITGAIIIYETN